MPAEQITLRFLDYEPLRAEAMLGCARRFASEEPDKPPGERNGTVYAFKGWACVAYWTPARAVVVREVSNAR